MNLIMNEHRSVANLAKDIVVSNILGGKAVIGIDGSDGVGKTRLATELSKFLNCTKLSLDDCMERNQGTYVASIKYEEVRCLIDNAKGIVLLDGVCLLEVVEKIGVELDILIYVKRMHYGLWFDQDLLDSNEDVNELFEREDKKLEEVGVWFSSQEGRKPLGKKCVALSDLTKEVVNYHVRYLPHKKADYYFSVDATVLAGSA